MKHYKKIFSLKSHGRQYLGKNSKEKDTKKNPSLPHHRFAFRHLCATERGHIIVEGEQYQIFEIVHRRRRHALVMAWCGTRRNRPAPFLCGKSLVSGPMPRFTSAHRLCFSRSCLGRSMSGWASFAPCPSACRLSRTHYSSGDTASIAS